MSAIIFVWRPHSGQVGHASMSLTDGTYISWWPSSENKDDSKKTKDGVLNAPAMSYSMSIDKKAERNRIPDYASAPVNGLNEVLISSWWRQISGRTPNDYSSTRHEPKSAVGKFRLFSGANCSNMVVRGLVVGGLNTKYPIASTIIGNNLIMTPLTLIDVAECITGNTGNKLVSYMKSPNSAISMIRTVFQYL